MTQTKHFSTLKKQIENLLLPSLKMEVCCLAYPVRSQYGSSSVPRFYIRLGKMIIWDFPGQFPIRDIDYHMWESMVDISALLREYIDTPLAQVPTKAFEGDNVEMPDGSIFNLGLTAILKAADRRMGRAKLAEMIANPASPAVCLVLNARLAAMKPR